MKEGEGRLAVENSTWVFRMEVRCHYMQHLVHCVSTDRCVITHMWQLCLPGGCGQSLKNTLGMHDGRHCWCGCQERAGTQEREMHIDMHTKKQTENETN